MLAITASALAAYTTGSLRGARIGWELFAGLLVISLLLPAGIAFLISRLPDFFAS